MASPKYRPEPNRFPDITIKHEVYRKITAYADLCNDEISALGSVVVNEEGILVDDIFLFEQTVTGTSTEISSGDIAKFICDYISQGKDPATLKFWWHSHVNMSVFWSGTDTSTINRFSGGFMISMVSNKQNQHKLRVDLFSPFRMYMDDLPYRIEYDKSQNTVIQKEINAKVKRQFFPNFFPSQSPAYSQGHGTPASMQGVVDYALVDQDNENDPEPIFRRKNEIPVPPVKGSFDNRDNPTVVYRGKEEISTPLVQSRSEIAANRKTGINVEFPAAGNAEPVIKKYYPGDLKYNNHDPVSSQIPGYGIKDRVTDWVWDRIFRPKAKSEGK